MKLKLVLSLLFIILSKGINEKKNTENISVFIENTQSVNDSINYYYEKSRSKEYDLKKKLFYINKAISSSSEKGDKPSFFKMLSYKSAIYGNTKKNYSEAIEVALELYNDALVYKDTFYMAKASFKIGRYQSKINNYIEAYKYYNEALEYNRYLKDSLRISEIAEKMATIQNDLGDYYGAEQIIVEALPYVENITKETNVSWLYQILGRSTRDQRNYADAIKWYNRAINKEKRSRHLWSIKQNLAVTYTKYEKYEKAISIFADLINKSDEINNESCARVIDNYAFVRHKSGRVGVKDDLIEALNIRKEIKDIKGQFSSNMHLMQYSIDLEKPEEGILYGEKALEIAKKIKSPDAELEALFYLIEVSEISNLKNYSLRYKELTDSIITSRSRNKNQFSKIRMRTDNLREEKTIAIQKSKESNLKAETAEFKNYIYISVIIIVLLILFFLIYYFQQRKRKIQIQERYQTETRLSKKVHDEVGNDVFYLMTQIENDPSLLEKNGLKLLDGLQNIYSKARDISREYTDIDTREGFPEELLSLLNSFGNKEVKIITKQLGPAFWTLIDPDLKSEVFRIVQELLTNMKKHSQASFVAVTFKKESQKLMIQYSDNGIGVDGEKPALKSVENRIQVLKGVLTFDSQSDEGLNISIILPM